TWAYVAGQWENLTTPGSPSPREEAYLTYDPADGGLLLFGGITGASASNCLTDTWMFNGTRWAQLTPTTTPGCTNSGLVYDANLGHPLLLAAAHGGNLASEANVSWEYTGGTWSRLAASSNFWRGNPVFVYDTTDAETILFGGFDISCGCQNLGDTWAFKGGAWSQLNPVHSPSARTFEAGTDDPAGGGILLFGGHYTGVFYNDTWVFHNGDWTQPSTAVAPSVRWGEALASDPSDGRVLLFGGFNFTAYASQYSGETWAFDFASPITAVSLSVTPPSILLGGEIAIQTSTSGGLGLLTYAYTGLPAGCPSSNQSSLLCVPAVTGNFLPQVTVTDQVGRSMSGASTLSVHGASGTVPLVLSELVAIPSTVTVGDTLTLAAIALGGSGVLAFAWSGLPTGCTATTTPTITCTPTAAGTFVVGVKVVDPTLAAVFGNVTVAVDPVPVVTPPPGPSGVTLTALPNPATVGQVMAFAVGASGGAGALTFTFTGLPAGCASENASTILCVPSAAGSTTASVTVSDSLGRTAAATVTAVVAAVSHPTTPTVNGSSSATSTANMAMLLGEAAVVVALVAVVLAILALMRGRPPAAGAKPRP
ncbi:MAG: hypothetical protein L3J73_00090, partial [Thermoplasmata archaeon]|nr:hypothetical protein [Thermoplasmata archaeon]